jgi:hypothetical protein
VVRRRAGEARPAGAGHRRGGVLRRHGILIAWAKERGLFVRVDCATPWGNPFVIGNDGDRATIIARYRDHHLPRNPGLLARLGELRG